MLKGKYAKILVSIPSLYAYLNSILSWTSNVNYLSAITLRYTVIRAAQSVLASYFLVLILQFHAVDNLQKPPY